MQDSVGTNMYAFRVITRL